MVRIDEDGNITVTEGNTFKLIYTDVKIDSVAVNWTGYTASFLVKSASGTTLFELTQASGIDLTTNGQITLLKSSAEMALLANGTYYYDFKFTKDGIVDTWFNNKRFRITT